MSWSKDAPSWWAMEVSSKGSPTPTSRNMERTSQHPTARGLVSATRSAGVRCSSIGSRPRPFSASPRASSSARHDGVLVDRTTTQRDTAAHPTLGASLPSRDAPGIPLGPGVAVRPRRCRGDASTRSAQTAGLAWTRARRSTPLTLPHRTKGRRVAAISSRCRFGARGAAHLATRDPQLRPVSNNQSLRRGLGSDPAPHAAARRPSCKLMRRRGRAPWLSDGRRNGDDLGELHRVDELSETGNLAVTDIPDVDGGQVQRLPSRFAGPHVADDHGDGSTGSHELLGYHREAVDVLGNRAKDLLRDGL